jgi:hypothetical protein
MLSVNVEPSMVTGTVVSIAPPAPPPAVLALKVLLRTINKPPLEIAPPAPRLVSPVNVVPETVSTELGVSTRIAPPPGQPAPSALRSVIPEIETVGEVLFAPTSNKHVRPLPSTAVPLAPLPTIEMLVDTGIGEFAATV